MQRYLKFKKLKINVKKQKKSFFLQIGHKGTLTRQTII
jgi:hypothetical protein